MNHLSDDLLYDLAVKVAAEEDLSPREEAALMHVTECDACYRLLCAAMTMLEVAQNIGAYAVDPAPVDAIQPVRETIRAVLRLAVDTVNSVLDQISADANAWTFRTAPKLLAGTRGFGKSSSVKKLTDQENRKNFVAYDPDKKLLMIQLDASVYSEMPAAFLTLPDGTKKDLVFERRGEIFWSEVTGLENGDYEITLVK